MEFRFAHSCLTVRDLKRSLAFYEQALGLVPTRRLHPADQDIELTFLSDGKSAYELELGCPADQTKPPVPGDVHIAFSVADMDAAHALHESMGVISRDNPEVEVYFIADPDGHQIEIIPEDPKDPPAWEYLS